MVHVCPFDQEGKLLVHLKKVGNETKALPLASQGKIFLGSTRYSPLKFSIYPKFWSYIFKEHLFQTIFCNIQVYHLLRNHSKWLDWSNFRPQKWAPVDRFIMMSGRWSMGFRLQRLLLTVSRSCWDRLKKNYLSIKSLLRKLRDPVSKFGFWVWDNRQHPCMTAKFVDGRPQKRCENWSGRESFLCVQVVVYVVWHVHFRVEYHVHGHA